MDPAHDLPAVAAFLGRSRALGALTHPGGIQWWLRELANGDRDDFGAYVWSDGAAIGAFALVDGTFVVAEQAEDGPTRVDQLAWLEDEMRAHGRDSLRTHVAESDATRTDLVRRGYVNTGLELELVADTASEPAVPALPAGFRWASLEDVADDAFIAGHRAAWSDNRPSPYRRELHAAVRRMPQFRPDLVTIAFAPDGTVASYCIGWMDERSETLEIEPLGTHRDYRRRGLAHAVVKEVQHRAWANGAKHVLVWNHPTTNAAAYGLYTGADMPPNRTLIELAKPL
ncbi:MAG TPA: GNAT family N-acetyltransferase [Candidatus Limnocylindrales bacterium]|jgi:predicted GNAT family acetyltransferase